MTALDDRLSRQRALLAGISAPAPTTPSVSTAAPAWLHTVGQEAQESAEKPRSLWEQLVDPITHFLPGVTGFLGDVAESAVAVPRLAYDATLGGGIRRDENFSGLQSYLAQYAPAFNTVGTSFVHTGQNILHPTNYLKAIEEGRIVDTILQDVGNLALAGGAAAKVLGTAGSVTTGLTEAAARAAETAGGAITPALPEAAAAAGESAMAGRTLLGPLGGEIPAKFVNLVDEAPIYSAQFPARGLAGIAKSAGNLQLAEQLGTVGRGVRTITSLGEAVGNAPAKPFALAGRALGRGLDATGQFPKLSAMLAGEYVAPEALAAAETVNPYQNSRLYRALVKGNQMWKTSILPFSPKWHIGNTVGNMLQAALHGGVGPVALIKRMRQIADDAGGWRKLWQDSGIAEWTPERIARQGLTHAEWLDMRDYMDALPQGRIAGSAIGRGFKSAVTKSWKLNEFVDNMTRQALYLEKLGKGVPNEAAIQSVLRSLGDFQRLSPVERNLVRQVLPFYTWLRHQTIATLRLPLTSPTRAAMLANLGTIYSDPSMQSELVSFVGSRLPLGGNEFLDFGGVSPFADLTESPFGPFDPRSIGGAVSPILKFPAAAGFGIDLNRLDSLGRPSSTRSVGVFGEEATPPITRLFSDPVHALGELGYIATQMGPAPIRSLRDLALGPEQRYRTGYVYGDETDPNKTPLRLLLRGLNLPSKTTIDIEELQREMEQTQRRLAG